MTADGEIAMGVCASRDDDHFSDNTFPEIVITSLCNAKGGFQTEVSRDIVDAIHNATYRGLDGVIFPPQGTCGIGSDSFMYHYSTFFALDLGGVGGLHAIVRLQYYGNMNTLLYVCYGTKDTTQISAMKTDISQVISGRLTRDARDDALADRQHPLKVALVVVVSGAAYSKTVACLVLHPALRS